MPLQLMALIKYSGLDHLYEPIEEYVHEEETTVLQDATPTAAKDDETDVEG